MPKTRGMDSERHRARSTITMNTTMTVIINVIIIVITTITTTNTVIIHVAILIITQIRDGFRPSIRVTAPRKHYLLFQPYLHPVSAAFCLCSQPINVYACMYTCINAHCLQGEPLLNVEHKYKAGQARILNSVTL